jgi:hypothetical protein
MASMDFYNLVCNRESGEPCALDAWVSNLPNMWPASLLRDTVWGFAAVQAVHLLALGLLGGCVILLGMRMFGVGLTSEPASALERQLRPWLTTGVVAVLTTGVYIGMLNPEKLYTSPAFFVKMVSMAAALILTFGVMSSVARNEGVVSRNALIAGAIAGAIWLWSLGLFATSQGTNPGSIHIVTAGYLILVAYARKLTRLIAIGLVGVLALVYVIYGYPIMGGPFGADYDAFMNLAKSVTAIAGVALVGLLGYELATGDAADSQPAAKIIGLFTILAWVTCAAAGRWIGLS